MIPQRIEHLLVKFLLNESDSHELDELEEWVKTAENQEVFKDFIKTHYTTVFGMKNVDPNKMKERLRREMRRDKNAHRKKKLLSITKYAAIALFFTCIGIFFQQYFFDGTNKGKMVPREEAITLQMDNGEVQIISDSTSSQIKDQDGAVLGEQSGGKLVYKKENLTEKLNYNVLKVPYGKKFDVYLSDGTHVFLNAGSSLRYPVSFLKGQTRQVFLSGEAYFDVAHDTKNPFLVGTQELNVKVYGTKFNVSNYASDNDIDIVLVEGSVAIEAKENNSDVQEKLKPGFKGAFDKTHKTISTEKVNTTIYTAWMNGDLVFRDAPFATIIKRLERQYNVIIINNNKKLDKEAFNATFETDRENLEQVFDFFDDVYNIDYQFSNNKIIIN